jgi:hypothetical protein
MRKLFTALAAIAVILVAGPLVGKAEATMVTGVATLLALTKNSSPVANVACWCGNYQCACRGPVWRALCEAQSGEPRQSEGVS